MLTDALMKCMIRLSKGRKELRGLKLYQFAYFAPGQGLERFPFMLDRIRKS